MEKGVVLEIGTGLARAGYFDDDLPIICTRSLVGKETETEKKFFGSTETMFGHKGEMLVESPFDEGGELVRVDKYSELWKELLEHRLCTNMKETPLMLIEDSFRTKEERMKLAEICFEEMEHPSMFISKAQTLSAFSLGKSSGLIVDCGDSSIRVVPIYNGRVLTTAMEKRKDLGGNKLTDDVLSFLNKKFGTITPHLCIEDSKGKSFIKERTKSLIEEIKESFFFNEKNSEKENTFMCYEFPDKTDFVFEKEIFDIPENFFSLNDGIRKTVSDVIKKCPIQIHNTLLSNLVVCGGMSTMNGFVERINEEIQIEFQNLKMKQLNTLEKKFSSWTGGSILATLPDFQHLWINKEEYEENGASCIDKRDF